MAELTDSGSKSCPFCGRSSPEVRFTKEHVIRAKLERFFPGEPWAATKLFQWHLDAEGAGRERQIHIPQGPFQLTVNKVCSSCNNGWMNELVEGPAEASLVAAMQGGSPIVAGPDAKAVALWGMKTAAVRSLMDSGTPAIPPWHFHHVMHHLEPPPGVFVWMAHQPNHGQAFTRHQRFSATTIVPPVHCHLTTFILGHLALYVAGASVPVTEYVIGQTIAQLRSRALEIWPGANSNYLPAPAIDPVAAEELSSLVELG